MFEPPQKPDLFELGLPISRRTMMLVGSIIALKIIPILSEGAFLLPMPIIHPALCLVTAINFSMDFLSDTSQEKERIKKINEDTLEKYQRDLTLYNALRYCEHCNLTL